MIHASGPRPRALAILKLLIRDFPIPRVTRSRDLHKFALAVDRRCWCGILGIDGTGAASPLGTEEHALFECRLIDSTWRAAVLKLIYDTFGDDPANELFFRVLREGDWAHFLALAKPIHQYTRRHQEITEKVQIRLGRPS